MTLLEEQIEQAEAVLSKWKTAVEFWEKWPRPTPELTKAQLGVAAAEKALEALKRQHIQETAHEELTWLPKLEL